MSWPCEDVAAHEFVARGEERGTKYEKRGRVEDDAARGQPDSPCGEFSRKRALLESKECQSRKDRTGDDAIAA